MRVIEPSSWRAQRWKNGKGITHEVWRTPEGDGADDYDVRVSVAELTTDGPFSRFPGYRRWSFLVGTAPIELTYDQRASREPAVSLVAPGDHVQLPGDVAVTAHLRAGSTHLLNIFARVPLVAGYGPIGHPVRLVFALAPRPELDARTAVARWAALLHETPIVTDTTDCIWIADSSG